MKVIDDVEEALRLFQKGLPIVYDAVRGVYILQTTEEQRKESPQPPRAILCAREIAKIANEFGVTINDVILLGVEPCSGFHRLPGDTS